MDDVINDDSRNNGIKVAVRYQFSTSTLVYDLKEVDGKNSSSDVFRVFLQFAEKVADTKFENVNIAYKGKTKFVLSGDHFNTIGKEYSFQNPVYTMRTFPEKLKLVNGTKAYSTWTGGTLGVSSRQIEDFNDFIKKWFLDDI
jgi:hypothetical protein